MTRPQPASATAWISALAIAGGLTIAHLSGQQRRDGAAAPPPARGTATLSGTLVTDDNEARPIRRATVQLNGGDSASGRLAVTDDSGRFVFAALPAATFSVVARRAGYVDAYYGAKRPGMGPGVPIAIGDGQQLSVTLRMAKGAAITGTISDQRGKPVPQRIVYALAVTAAGANNAPRPATATTDDRGVYRIFGLAPGPYLVAVTFNPGLADTRIVTDDEVRWAMLQLAPPSPGAPSAPLGAPPPKGRPANLAPMFYPGTADPAEATKITLGPGEEHGDVSIAAQLVPTAHLDGSIVDNAGQTVSRAVAFLTRATPLNFGIATFGVGFTATGSLRSNVADGTFWFAGVIPGRYRVFVTGGVGGPPLPSAPAGPGGLAGGGRAAGAGPGAFGPASPATMYGEIEVTANGRDQSGLVVALQPGGTLSGTVAFDSTSATPSTDRRVRMSLVALRPSPSGPPPNGTVNQDGTFSFPPLPPGPYLIRPIPLPPTSAPSVWTLRSVIVDGRDAADVPIEIRTGGAITGVVATFTDRAPEISGTLIDAAGKPAPGFSIIVFSADRAMWGEQSRRTRAVHPATDGSYSVRGLPAGDYVVSAVTDYDPSDLSDASFLDRLAAAGRKVTLADGQKVRQDWRIGG